MMQLNCLSQNIIIRRRFPNSTLKSFRSFFFFRNLELNSANLKKLEFFNTSWLFQFRVNLVYETLKCIVQVVCKYFRNQTTKNFAKSNPLH